MFGLKRSKSSASLTSLSVGNHGLATIPLPRGRSASDAVAGVMADTTPSGPARGRTKSLSGKSSRSVGSKSMRSMRSWRSARSTSSSRYRAFEGGVDDLSAFAQARPRKKSAVAAGPSKPPSSFPTNLPKRSRSDASGAPPPQLSRNKSTPNLRSGTQALHLDISATLPHPRTLGSGSGSGSEPVSGTSSPSTGSVPSLSSSHSSTSVSSLTLHTPSSSSAPSIISVAPSLSASLASTIRAKVPGNPSHPFIDYVPGPLFARAPRVCLGTLYADKPLPDLPEGWDAPPVPRVPTMYASAEMLARRGSERDRKRCSQASRIAMQWKEHQRQSVLLAAEAAGRAGKARAKGRPSPLTDLGGDAARAGSEAENGGDGAGATPTLVEEEFDCSPPQLDADVDADVDDATTPTPTATPDSYRIDLDIPSARISRMSRYMADWDWYAHELAHSRARSGPSIPAAPAVPAIPSFASAPHHQHARHSVRGRPTKVERSRPIMPVSLAPTELGTRAYVSKSHARRDAAVEVAVAVAVAGSAGADVFNRPRPVPRRAETDPAPLYAPPPRLFRAASQAHAHARAHAHAHGHAQRSESPVQNPEVSELLYLVERVSAVDLDIDVSEPGTPRASASMRAQQAHAQVQAQTRVDAQHGRTASYASTASIATCSSASTSTSTSMSMHTARSSSSASASSGTTNETIGPASTAAVAAAGGKARGARLNRKSSVVGGQIMHSPITQTQPGSAVAQRLEMGQREAATREQDRAGVAGAATELPMPTPRVRVQAPSPSPTFSNASGYSGYSGTASGAGRDAKRQERELDALPEHDAEAEAEVRDVVAAFPAAPAAARSTPAPRQRPGHGRGIHLHVVHPPNGFGSTMSSASANARGAGRFVDRQSTASRLSTLSTISYYNQPSPVDVPAWSRSH